MKKKVEEELEKRKDEIEQEVAKRVEEAKKKMEKEMMEELERQKEQQRQEELARQVTMICYPQSSVKAINNFALTFDTPITKRTNLFSHTHAAYNVKCLLYQQCIRN